MTADTASPMVDALVVHGRGDLRIDRVPAAEPGPGEVSVAPRWGGICGSDMHYVQHGGVGASVLRAPMILGHEVSGMVVSIGDGVTGFRAGDAVAIHPARPCGHCPECRRGMRHLCRDMRFLGSAALVPHTDGGFRRGMVVEAGQLRALPPGLDLRRAAIAEPFAVALHAVSRAGAIAGRSVLVQGAGPIGALVVAALRLHGAGRIVATDLHRHALSVACGLGADEGWTPAEGDAAEEFDIVFEATGAIPALGTAIRRTRRGGVLVQVGMFPPGDVPVALGQILARELDLRGTFRFDHEFDEALASLAAHPDIADRLITRDYRLGEFAEAFALSADRSVASKVLLDLDG